MSDMRQPSPPSGSWPLVFSALGLLCWLIGARVAVAGGPATTLMIVAGTALLLATTLRLMGARRAQGATARAERGLLLGHLILLASFGLGALVFDADTGTAPQPLTALWWLLFLPSCAATAAMERAWLTMPTANSVEPKRLLSNGAQSASLALLLVFLFGVNVAAHHKDWRKDLTFFQTTAASESTRALVRQLEHPVTALLFFAPVSDTLDQLRPYFDELAASSGQLHVRVIDQAFEPALARKYRVRSNGFVVLVKGTPARATSADKAAPSERFEVGEELDRARRNLKKLDGLFHRRLAKLSRARKRLRFTAGHQERSRRGAPTDARGLRMELLHGLLARLNVSTDALSIADGLAKEVPKGTSAVVVAGPRQRMLQEEVDTLLRYVNGGGRLLVLADPPRKGEQDDGLEPLLNKLGVARLNGTVASKGHHMRSTYTRADRALVYSNTFSSHPSVSSASRSSQRVTAVFARAAALHRHSAPPRGARITFPVRTTSDCWTDADGDLNRGPKEPRRALNLMAAVTLPKSASGTGAQGRVVIIGDGDFATDALIKARGNALILVDSLRWLIGDEKLIGDISSEEDVAIEHRKDEDRLWFYATTFGMPLPLLLLGLWVGRRRRGGGR